MNFDLELERLRERMERDCKPHDGNSDARADDEGLDDGMGDYDDF